MLGHRRGDPDRVAVRGQPRQRRHQPARPALDLAARVERHGPAVGHQHQRASLCRCAAHDCGELAEDPQIVAQVARRQEVRAHVLLAAPARAPCRAPGRARISSARSAHCSTLETRYPVTPSSICSGMPPTSPPMNGSRLPDRLGDGQAEALARGLLHDHVGVGLERVDLDRADVVEVVEDVDVRVAVGVGDRRVEEVPALGVVGGHRADQRELHVWHRLP